MDHNDFLSAIPPETVQQMEAAKGKRYSDITDDAGCQYIDLVMEGGGMLGLALVGYTYALEQAGIRFLRIGGTSAGAINALLLAAVDLPAKPKSEIILGHLAGKNFYDFVDGDDDAKDFVNAVLDHAGKWKLLWKGVQVIDNINENLGLNTGDNFLQWLTEVLEQHAIVDMNGLNERMRTLPPLTLLKTEDHKSKLLGLKESDPRLAVITSELSTETKVEFPSMSDMFWEDPGSVNPAKFVRCSMSIPLFFTPYRIPIPANTKFALLWRRRADATYIPPVATFVDGGIMSNFPIGIFHDDHGAPQTKQGTVVPFAPTFGVKLGYAHRTPTVIDNPKALVAGIFNAARHTLDYDFLMQHPEYRQLVAYAGVDKDFNWLDFEMPRPAQIQLFVRGVQCGADFLTKFNWDSYKKFCRLYRRVQQFDEAH